MSLPARVLDSATQLTRNAVFGHGQAEDLAGLAHGQKDSLSRPRSGIDNESGSSRFPYRPGIPYRSRKEVASERFRGRSDRTDANREVDSFLAAESTPLDLPNVVGGKSGPETTTSLDLPVGEDGTEEPARIIPACHRDLLFSMSEFFYARDKQPAEHGLSPEQIKHTSLSDLRIQPRDVLAQHDTVFQDHEHFWKHLHDARCQCGQTSHYLELLNQITYNLLNDPKWYRYQESSAELGGFHDPEHTVKTPIDASGLAPTSLEDLPVAVDVNVFQALVNMSWLHDPYCACQQTEHRAQLRREWEDARKAIEGREKQKDLEEYLLGHMHSARLEGYLRSDILSPQDLSQNILRSRAPAVARVNMIKSQTASAAPSEATKEKSFMEYLLTGPSGEHALQDYQLQLMQLEQQNKARLLKASQKHDTRPYGPLSKLFPDYADLPLESRAIPFDVLVNRYQQAVAAANFSLTPMHLAPVSPELLDIPSLLKDHQRQRDAYTRSRSDVTNEDTPEISSARGRLRPVERRIEARTLHKIREFWAEETSFSADVEEAKTDSPLAMARRFNHTFRAQLKTRAQRAMADTQKEWEKDYIALSPTGMSDEALAMQSAEFPTAYPTLKLLAFQLKVFEEKRAANKSCSERDTAMEAKLQADFRRWHAKLQAQMIARAQEQFEQSRLSVHDATHMGMASDHGLLTQMRATDEQLHMQNAGNQASGISSTQTTKADSPAQQSTQASTTQHQTPHGHTSLNQRFPVRLQKSPSEAHDEDVQLEDFHCPYPACHDLLAGGESALKVEREGRTEVWCAHAGCLESFSSKQRWGRHICTPHHDLVGLGSKGEE